MNLSSHLVTSESITRALAFAQTFAGNSDFPPVISAPEVARVGADTSNNQEL